MGVPMTEPVPLPDEALAALRGWLGDGWTAAPLAGDASTRAYYRITRGDGTTNVLAWYPEDVRPVLQRFLEAYAAVSPYAYVPRVIESSGAAALQQDVGDRTLFDLLHDAGVLRREADGSFSRGRRGAEAAVEKAGE